MRAMKLAPEPNSGKANTVGNYRSILQSTNNSWIKAESSYADSTSYNNSSQEECLRVANKHHRNKKRSSKSSKKSIDLSISDSSSEEEHKPKKKHAVEMVVTCKYCKKYERKTNHPSRIVGDKCMWNKKVACLRYERVCRKMGLEYVKKDKFEKGKEDKWPKHKAAKDENDD